MFRLISACLFAKNLQLLGRRPNKSNFFHAYSELNFHLELHLLPKYLTVILATILYDRFIIAKSFLPRDATQSAVIPQYVVWLSICRLSVCPWRSGTGKPKRNINDVSCNQR